MRAYSMDLRERVWADCQTGMKTPAVAQKYSVSASWVRRLKQRHKATGSLAPRPPGPGRPSKVQPHDARVRELVRDDPDATRLRDAQQVELDELFRARQGRSAWDQLKHEPARPGVCKSQASLLILRYFVSSPLGCRILRIFQSLNRISSFLKRSRLMRAKCSH